MGTTWGSEMSAQVFAREMRLAIDFEARDRGNSLAGRQSALAQLLADYREECRAVWIQEAHLQTKKPQTETQKRK